jgi:hypothetical protein
LNVAIFLAEHLPEIWELCLSGSLDRYRAVTVVDILRHRLDTPEHWARAGVRIARFLRRHLRRYDEFNIEMVTCTTVQLRNKVNYETRILRTEDEEFERGYADRTVRAIEFPAGLGQLAVTSSVDQVRLARHRLHLTAKSMRASGDERTIEQLMSDVALDLLIGRAEGVPLPSYARPIINVTVPLETLAGLRDDPATLSGGTVIPAELARAIATSEGATWFRLLTDAEDRPVSLSTKSYQPTTTIWRYVVGTQATCAHPACDRPSVDCELDHVEAWPAGATEVSNLQPLCRRHHIAKHAAIERPDLDWEFALAG